MLLRTLIAAGLTVSVATANLHAEKIKQEERDYQDQAFQTWWGIDLVRKLADLPAEAKVPDFRTPYAGFMYPDSGGGTDIRSRGGLSPLGKYDTAFNEGRGLAVAHERMDITAHRNAGSGRGRLFGGRLARLEQLNRPIGLIERARARRAPGWHGHCNGSTAAAIRHAEPQKSVVRGGVTFTPADIKALLAEIYMYSDTEFLGGIDAAINPGTLHITLANWIGRGDHSIGMDTTLGQVTYNYPIYAYKATITKRSDRESEVQMKVTYKGSPGYEPDKAPKMAKTMSFHYMLDLDADGVIVGGRYLSGSARIDMLWAPLKPAQGGEEGNENGSPHIDVSEVIAIWEDSVPEDLRTKWPNIDPYRPAVETEEPGEDANEPTPEADS